MRCGNKNLYCEYDKKREHTNQNYFGLLLIAINTVAVPRFSLGLICCIVLFCIGYNVTFIVQLGEHRTLDRKVAGSIITRGAVLCP